MAWKAFHSLTELWALVARPSPGRAAVEERSGRAGSATEELWFDLVAAMIGIFLIEILSPGGELIFNQLILQC